MPLTTTATELLGITHPIVSAPMAAVAGGRLAAAVSRAGGLGLIGGGYGDRAWLTREFEFAADPRVGCGFITWSLAGQPELLDVALAYRPVAVMLSFGDPAPFADAVKRAGALLICQIQDLDQADRALQVGADLLVAQGSEAGGHGYGHRWPPGHTMAVLRNTFTERWHGAESDLEASGAGVIAGYQQAVAAGDYRIANVTAGQAAGLIHATMAAGDIVTVLAGHAAALLGR